MAETQYAEFPLDDVARRVRHMLEVAPVVGKRLLESQHRVGLEESESDEQDRELMSRAERIAEEPLLASIQTEFPSDHIHSEEEGEIGEESEFQWWLDPLDGARNYVKGMPLYCVAIGLCFREKPAAGIVYVPAFDEIYHAIYGAGAFKNGSEIAVSSQDALDRGLVSTGLPYQRREILRVLVADISAFVATGAGIRRSGSAVLDLCWLAEGRVDAVWERGVSPWDACASSVIVSEAGGRITDYKGRAFDMFSPELVASNSRLHSVVLETLRKADDVTGMN